MYKPKQYIPTAYQRGYIEFYKLKFKVTPAVLIPRPETELLVDGVLTHVKNNLKKLKPFTILDIGTGAGNISISLSVNLQGCNVKIIATDVSIKALTIAKQNAKLHRVLDKIDFIKSDLLSGISDSLIEKANPLIIVTNLPYIPSARINYLDSSVKNFEPHLALDGGKDGFELYRKLFKQVKSHLGGGMLFIGEIDYTHDELAVKEAQKYFPDAKIEVKTDLAHKQRMLIITH